MQENIQQAEAPIHEQIKNKINTHGLKQSRLIQLLDLGVSTGYFCEMLNGKKPLIPEILTKLQNYLSKFD